MISVVLQLDHNNNNNIPLRNVMHAYETAKKKNALDGNTLSNQRKNQPLLFNVMRV